MERRQCPSCLSERPLVSFVTGRSWCQICATEKSTKVYSSKATIEANRLNRVDVRARARGMASRAANRAKRFGYEYNLTIDWIEEKLRVGVCEMSFIPFVLDWDGRRRNPWCPTLDRKDNKRGYTTDNVSMVCWIYNAAKCDGPHSDVLLLARGLLGTLTETDIASVSGIAQHRVAIATQRGYECMNCGGLVEGRGSRRFCSMSCQVQRNCRGPFDAALCWVWDGAIRKNGYGVINTEHGAMSPARAMYISKHGPPENGWPVINTCGTKNCCNPDHLVVHVPKAVVNPSALDPSTVIPPSAVVSVSPET